MNRVLWKCTVLYFLCFAASFCYSQNYKMFDTGRTRTWAQEEKYFSFSKIDSVIHQESDSIYYFSLHLDTLPTETCVAIEDTIGVLGSKMVMLNDAENTHVFFNQSNDSIFIKLRQPVNTFWTMYTYPDGTTIRATVVAPLEITVLPETFDSIYRLRLNVYDSDFIIQLDSAMNDRKIEVAKNYGLVEFFDFRVFPYDTISVFLRGITNPENSIVDVDSRNAFDFQPGNEFHYITTEKSDADGDVTGYIAKEKYFVADKIQSAESVQYTMYYVGWKLFTDGVFAGDTVRTIDTITVAYNYADYGFLDSLELTVFEANNFGFSDFLKSDTIYWGRAYKEVYDWFSYDEETGCLSNPDNIFLPEQTYGDGVGLMWYKDSTDAENYFIREQVFFQKGLEVWGKPFDFAELGVVSIEEISIANQIQLFPNPATDFISFVLPNATDVSTIRLIDINGKTIDIASGRLLQTAYQPNAQFELNIAELASGVYMIVITGNNVVYFGKFIKY